MVAKKLIATALLIFATFSFCYSQSADTTSSQDTTRFTINPNSSLIYYVDNSFNSNQFLIPYIETELKLMRDTINRKLFSSVVGINYFIATDHADTQLQDLFKMFDSAGKDTAFDKRLKERDTSISNRVKKAQFFLKININAFNNLLEYQFVLVKIVVRPTNDKNFFDLTKYRTMSIFIDPNKPDYKRRIKNCLYVIFQEANHPPVPMIYYDKYIVGDTLYTQPGIVKLTATAVDEDSEQIRYKWKVNNSNQLLLDTNTNLYSPYATGNDIQLDVYPGDGKVTLYVNDGINEKTKTVTIITKPAPSIEILPKRDLKAENYYNNSFHIYSYHKKFRPNDFLSAYDLLKKAMRQEDISVKSRWLNLLPEIIVLSDCQTINKEINFYIIQKHLSDKAKFETMLGWPTAEMSDDDPLFAVKKESGITNTNIPLINSNYYEDYFSLFANNNLSDTISVPSLKTFTVKMDCNGLRGLAQFNIQFNKVSRFCPYLTFSQLFNYVNNYTFDFDLVGAGAQYLLLPSFYVNADIGTVTTKSFSYKVLPFYRAGASTDLFGFQNILKAWFSIDYLYKEVYTYMFEEKEFIAEGYRGRLGFGGSISTGLGFSEYQPLTLGYSYFYYPNGYNVGRFYELGLSLKFTFAK